MKLPQYVKNCIDRLCRAGYLAYAVGGAVRDGLLGIEPSDWDVTTSARPEEILSVFSDCRTIPTGIKHGTVTLLAEHEGKSVPIEITTFRIDGEYRDSRHPESVSFSKDVRDDLSRRDFTVNAMAYNDQEGIIDVFGGSQDLENKIIRAVGVSEKRFSEDALRILRAFRFCAQLEFEIEEETLYGAKKCAPLLKNIARERIGAEMKRLLSSSGVSYALEKMIECDVWGAIFDIPAPEIDLIERLGKLENGSFEARLAILIADCEESQILKVLDCLRLSNQEKKLVLRLCSVGEFGICDEDNMSRVRNFLHYYKDILPHAIEVLRFYNRGAYAFFDAIELELSKNRPLLISDLAIRGNDLLPLCEGDHRRVGILLKYLLDRVIDDPELNERDKLIEIAKKSL